MTALDKSELIRVHRLVSQKRNKFYSSANANLKKLKYDQTHLFPNPLLLAIIYKKLKNS